MNNFMSAHWHMRTVALYSTYCAWRICTASVDICIIRRCSLCGLAEHRQFISCTWWKYVHRFISSTLTDFIVQRRHIKAKLRQRASFLQQLARTFPGKQVCVGTQADTKEKNRLLLQLETKFCSRSHQVCGMSFKFEHLGQFKLIF